MTQHPTKRGAPNDLPQEMARQAAVVVDAAKKEYGVDLDYSGESLSHVESIIESLSRDTSEALLKAIGAYVGEVLQRNLDGTWKWQWEEFSGTTVPALVKVGGEKITIFPIHKVMKRFKDGKGDDLVFYFEVLKSGQLK